MYFCHLATMEVSIPWAPSTLIATGLYFVLLFILLQKRSFSQYMFCSAGCSHMTKYNHHQQQHLVTLIIVT